MEYNDENLGCELGRLGRRKTIAEFSHLFSFPFALGVALLEFGSFGARLSEIFVAIKKPEIKDAIGPNGLQIPPLGNLTERLANL